MTDDPTIPMGTDPTRVDATRLAELPPPPSAPAPPAPPAAPVVPVRNSPALNAAWLAIGSIAAFVGLSFATVQTIGVLAHEERTERVTVADPAVAVLDIASDDGRIEVVGADVEDVRITARISEGLTETVFTHQVVGDRLQVRVRCKAVITGPWCQADLRIVVPRDLELKIRSSNDPVEVRSLDGRVDAQTDNGRIEADGLTGQAQLRSSNGSVRGTALRSDSIQADADNGSVHLAFDDPPLSTIAHSDNGSVDIAVPRMEQGYAVEVSSSNGAADNLVQTDSTSDHRVVATSSNGSVTVRYTD